MRRIGLWRWGAVALLLAGCGGAGGIQSVSEAPPVGTDTPRERLARSGNDSSIMDMLGERRAGNVVIGPGRGRTDPLAGSVNRQLWMASLDTLSFLPISSTDPFSGVIATDWGSLPDTPGERFRVTAFVTSTLLAPESLRVAVFRETRDRSGNWVSAPVAPETPRAIEDSILVRARQIRLEERNAG